jgi:hypothetical protein
METKEQLNQQIDILRKKINDIDEKEWQEKESPIFDKSIGRCFGCNELWITKKGKKRKPSSDRGYLRYYKLLERLTGDKDHSFRILVIEIDMDYENESFYRYGVQVTEEFFYSSDNIGSIYLEIEPKEFERVYKLVCDACFKNISNNSAQAILEKI